MNGTLLVDLRKYKVICWDFDGVIKDSVNIKTEAFKELFAPYGEDVQEKVISHHLQYNGISRAVKIPYYFEKFVKKPIEQDQLTSFLQQFSELTLRRLIESNWVTGVLEYIQKNYLRQKFYIVTGTPQKEIELIVNQLDLERYFKQTYGSPKKKEEILKEIIKKNQKEISQYLMIGDAVADYEAAQKAGIDFLLRETDYNRELFAYTSCRKIISFTQSLSI